MTRETQIRTLAVAEDSDLRSLEVTIGGKRIQTPTKTLDVRNFYSDTVFPPELSGLNEISLSFNEESLIKLSTNATYSRKKNQDILTSVQKGAGSPPIVLSQFNAGEGIVRYPNEKEIASLVTVAYTFSDIVPIPSIPNVARQITPENFDTFLNYLNDCYSVIEVLNRKPILGYLPMRLPLILLEDVLEFYLNHGINAYYLDFDGTKVTTYLTYLTNFKLLLYNSGYEEKSLFHFVNMSYGKAVNNQLVYPARDLVGFGFGLDSLGGVHTTARRPKEYYEQLNAQKDVQRNTTRLLNREDYGYYRFDLVADSLSSYPSDAMLPREELRAVKQSRCKKLVQTVNLQQQCLEADHLRTVVQETPKRTVPYFRTKRQLPLADLKKMGQKTLKGL